MLKTVLVAESKSMNNKESNVKYHYITTTATKDE